MSRDDRVSLTTAADGTVVRAAGAGLVDLQVNGYANLDFNGPVEGLTGDEVVRACQAMRRRGVVAFLATITTDAAERMLGRVAQLARLRRQERRVAEMVVGFHVEGPFISRQDGPRGAHPAEYATTPKDRPELLEQFQQAADGGLRLLTLAPELPGAMEVIARCAAGGTTVALGHHAAEAEVIAQAVAAGARMCTHLGNGSHALLPRLDNYVQHQLAEDRLAAGFIPDGHHIPFPTLKNFLRAKQFHRSVLVTDAVSAADMPPGLYGVGRRQRRVEADGAIRLPGTPYLAGSALTLDRGILNVVRHCDVPFEAAWAMASTQPARLVGLPPPPRIEVDVTDQGFRLRE